MRDVALSSMKIKSAHSCRFVHPAKFRCIMNTINNFLKIVFERGGNCLRAKKLTVLIEKIAGSFSFSPHLQFFTSKLIDLIVRLLWKLVYRFIRPWQTYMVSLFNLIKPLVPLKNWSSYKVGGKRKKSQIANNSKNFVHPFCTQLIAGFYRTCAAICKSVSCKIVLT